MQPYTCPCLRRLPCWYAALQHEPLVGGKLVHSVRRISVANKEASSQLPPYRPADMILPDSDDSEATCRPLRRFSLRVRLRALTPSTKPSSRNSRRWRLLQPLIARPVVGWTSGLDRRV